MSELGGHAPLWWLSVGQERVYRRAQRFCEPLKDARARHVLINLVSPKRVGSDSRPLRELYLREARTYAALT